MKQIRLTLIAGMLAIAASCGESKGADDNPAKAPELISATPEDGTSNLKTGTLELVLTFDQNIKCPSAMAAKISISPSGSVDKVSAYDADLKLILNLPEYATDYVLTIPAGSVSGFRDNPIDEDLRLTFSTCEEPEPVVPVNPDELPEPQDNDAWLMARTIALGFNLGNHMDAYTNDVANETCWGNPLATQQTFTKLKSYGFSSVRIPVTWMGHIGAAPDYQIEEAWMERVAEIVSYAKNAGLVCIVNTHHDENHNASAAHWLDIKSAAANSAKDEEIRREITAVWTQIAERFKDEGDYLIFESFNEINDGGWGWSDAFRKNPQVQYDILNAWNQVFVDAVRSTGGNNATRWLGVPGYATNIQLTIEGFVMPRDSAQGRIMVAVHCYDPSDFCGAGTDGSYQQWGHTGASGQKPYDDETSLRTTMATLYANYVAKGIPCYIGECGCVNKKTETGKAFQKYYLEYFAKCARSFGLPCIIWDNGVAATDNGESFGFVNHGTGAYIGNGGSVIPAMAKGMNENSSDYTLETVYNNAPRP